MGSWEWDITTEAFTGPMRFTDIGFLPQQFGVTYNDFLFMFIPKTVQRWKKQ